MLLAFTGGSVAAKPSLPASLSASKTVIDPTDATASITFNTDGTITNQDGGNLGNWTDKPGVADGANFRVKYDWSGGTNNLTSYPSGASDDVYTTDISTARTFTLTNTTLGTDTSTGTFTVEKISTGETDTASGSFTASVET